MHTCPLCLTSQTDTSLCASCAWACSSELPPILDAPPPDAGKQQTEAWVATLQPAFLAKVREAPAGRPYGAAAMLLHDDPVCDGTGAAHPAWWRGNDAAVVALADQVIRLSESDHDDPGVCPSAWQKARRRLILLRKVAEAARGPVLAASQRGPCPPDLSQLAEALRALDAKDDTGTPSLPLPDEDPAAVI